MSSAASSSGLGTVPAMRRVLRLGRKPVQALVDQAVSSLTNFATSLIAARLAAPSSFGRVALALSFAYMALIIGRALVGEPLLARVGRSRSERPEEQSAIDSVAIKTALNIGCIAGFMAAAAAMLPWPALSDCWLVSFWLPSLLVQDAVRYIAFSRRRPGIALMSDAVWALVQIAVIGAVLAVGRRDVTWVVVAWGAGATAGALAGSRQLRLAPVGRAREWIALTRRFSSWLAPQLVLGQVTAFAINLIVAAAFGTATVGGLRAMITISTPIFILLTAGQAVVVPALVRTLEQVGIAGMVRRVRMWAAAVSVAAAIIAVTCTVLSRPLVALLFGKAYAGFAPLVLPFAVGAAFHAAALLPSSGLRAFQDARSLLLVQLGVTSVSLAAVSVASATSTPLASAWALASQGLTAAALSWLAFHSRYKKAVGQESQAHRRKRSAPHAYPVSAR